MRVACERLGRELGTAIAARRRMMATTINDFHEVASPRRRW